MKELHLVGIGMNQDQLTLEAEKTLSECDKVFLEGYTSFYQGIEAFIERFSAEVLDREDVEDGRKIFDSAERQKTALAVVGDPFLATTHSVVCLEAETRGMRAVYIPGISIMATVPGKTGLSGYKFGRTTTLQYPDGDYFPTSPYDIIEKNLTADLHTLALLDIDKENGRHMSPGESMDLLLEAEERMGRDVIGIETNIVVLVDLFGPEEVVRYGPVEKLAKEEWPDGLACLVVPGTMHFMEEELLERFSV